ncbi:YlbD family protein [Robertmurraya sp. DFI.2.37]|uniref:YlbD family protein n=1 Tax=Robertmurraya sp. DFI.2.37 TaxID=3031819 RepID=UPI0012449E4B|nr:YlbD family protein [Robertmurraya sp. DFI.2.37]MDF1506712.1 YlbD family protein [Robertmurraya sp. DFI.2.37]
MEKKKLHPSVQQFKEFVKEHPKMVMEVRKGNATWQELFEEWYLLGDEDSRWDEFKGVQEKEEDKKEWLPQIMNAVKNVDPNQLQGHITNLSQALGAIQGLILQFQGGKQGSATSSNQPAQSSHPFQFRKD